MVPGTKFWRLGIVGWPLGYSLSPRMHEAALKAAELRGEYKEYPVKPEDLEDWLSHVKEFGLDGFNVTMPHKEAVFSWMKRQGYRLGNPELNGAIGAFNTVVLSARGAVGYNTDASGFLRPLLDPPRSLDLTGWQVCLMGAGGAAQAIAASLVLETGIQRLSIWNRNGSRGEALASKINALKPSREVAVAVDEIQALPIGKSRLLVSATPIGMEGKGQLPLDPMGLHQNLVVYDLVYEPRETALIKAARERGCRVITGDEMLAAQGAASFELWTGIKEVRGTPARKVMQKALEEHYARR